VHKATLSKIVPKEKINWSIEKTNGRSKMVQKKHFLSARDIIMNFITHSKVFYIKSQKKT